MMDWIGVLTGTTKLAARLSLLFPRYMWLKSRAKRTFHQELCRAGLPLSTANELTDAYDSIINLNLLRKTLMTKRK